MLIVQYLFNKKWTNLLRNYRTLEDSNYPGVYILAFAEGDLEGQSITIEDIFYVGMSNSRGGVKQRLKQFIDAINKNRNHSAGNRFFQEYCKGISFDIAGHNKTFFVASLSLPCNVRKGDRSPEDLRKMGEVAKFEYAVMACIKDKLGKEPELNKK
mgnify:FL=1